MFGVRKLQSLIYRVVLFEIAVSVENQLVTDRQTDRQTDRHTHDYGIYCASMTSRSNKMIKR